MTVGDSIRTDPGDQGEQRAAGSPPVLVADPAARGTGLILFPRTDSLPAAWVGPLPATGLEPADVAARMAGRRPWRRRRGDARHAAWTRPRGGAAAVSIDHGAASSDTRERNAD